MCLLLSLVDVGQVILACGQECKPLLHLGVNLFFHSCTELCFLPTAVCLQGCSSIIFFNLPYCILAKRGSRCQHSQMSAQGSHCNREILFLILPGFSGAVHLAQRLSRVVWADNRGAANISIVETMKSRVKETPHIHCWEKTCSLSFIFMKRIFFNDAFKAFSLTAKYQQVLPWSLGKLEFYIICLPIFMTGRVVGAGCDRVKGPLDLGHLLLGTPVGTLPCPHPCSQVCSTLLPSLSSCP